MLNSRFLAVFTLDLQKFYKGSIFGAGKSRIFAELNLSFNGEGRRKAAQGNPIKPKRRPLAANVGSKRSRCREVRFRLVAVSLR